MVTRISDVIVPEVFMRYVLNRSVELSRLIQSGIVQTTPQFNALVNGEGRTVNMPFWNDLDGEDTVVKGDGSELETGKLSTGKDVAIKVIRERGWSYSDLVQFLTAEDPAAAIGDMVAAYRVRRWQAQLLATLRGIFASGTLNDNTLDLHVASGGGTPTSANALTGYTFIDAEQCLGDHKEFLTGVMMHSRVEALLKKLDLIDFVPDSQGGKPIKTFQGREVVIDDGCPIETIDGKQVFSTFLFGKGALALGNGNGNKPIDGGVGTWETEFSREAKKGESSVIFRWHNIMHPRGVRFEDDTVADETPSNAELALGDNWARVYDPKNVRIVRVRSNLFAAA